MRGPDANEGRVVVHILSGDVWGGAEAAACGLLARLASLEEWKPAALLLNEGLAAARLRSAGLPVDVLSEKERSFLSLARAARAFLAKRNRPILHSHGYKEDLLAVLGSAGLRGRALVRTQHGSPYPRGPLAYRAAYRLDRWIARASFDAHVAVSEAVATDMRRFLPEEKIRVVRNGIEIPNEEAVPEADLPFGPESVVLSSLGRLAEEKRFDLLLAAAARAAAEVPEIRVLLIGDGPERKRLEGIASRLLPGKVHFAGFAEEPLSLLRKSDIYVLSSEREGLPISLLEAMAIRLPVVAPSVGGIPEVVRDGETGIVTAPGSEEELAAGIVRLARDPDARERMGEAGRRLVVRDYSIERTARETAAVYEGLEAER